MVKASLIVGPDEPRLIYEIEGSNQTYQVRFPFIKSRVSIRPVIKDDIIEALEVMEIMKDNRLLSKGILIVSSKLEDELKKVKGDTGRKKLESIGILANGKVTAFGFSLIQSKLIDELASLKNGFLAIDESGEKEKLVRFQY
jgi:hypothetical protein